MNSVVWLFGGHEALSRDRVPPYILRGVKHGKWEDCRLCGSNGCPFSIKAGDESIWKPEISRTTLDPVL